MFDLLKFFKTALSCQRNGVCTTSPILNAINAVILDEIRQIAFYMVKLREFNITNNDILREAICALSINITDVEFDKNAFRHFFLKLKATKEKTEEFYINQCREKNITHETLAPSNTSALDPEGKDFDLTSLIQTGEAIIKQFNSNLALEKITLLETVIIISKCASIKLFKLSYFKEDVFEYAFEILRLFSLTNNVLTREEKLVRRIKEFSNILYKINEELANERRNAWGKRSSALIDTTIYEGKSILVTGGDLEELYEVLIRTEGKNINVYTDISLVTCFSYPKFRAFSCLKGLYGLSDTAYDISNFKGAIYVSRNSNKQLANIFRGKIFTTKKIPFNHAVSIDSCGIEPIIEAALEMEGFQKEIEGEFVDFFFDTEAFNKTLEMNENREIFITAGIKNEESEAKFKASVKNEREMPIFVDFFPPDETEILYSVIKNSEAKNLNVYFSICTKESIYALLSILDKNIKNVFLTECRAMNINPHVIEALTKYFNVKTL